MSLSERFCWVVAGLVAFSVGDVNAENYSERHQEQIESLRQHLPHPTEFSQGAWRGTIEKDPITERVLGRLHTSTQEDKTQYYQENKDVRLEVRCDHMSETVGVTTEKELSSDQVTISYRFDEQDHVTTQWQVGPDGDIYPEYGLDGEEPAEFVDRLTESEEMLFRVINDDQLSLLSFSLKEFDSVFDEICGAFGDYREERERLMAEIQRERGSGTEGEDRLNGGDEGSDTQEGQVPSVEDLTERSRQRWQHAVENAWTRPPGSERGLKVDVRIRLKPDGEVVSAAVTESSGSRAFDRSAENAVRRASPLWVPDAEELFWNAGFDDSVLRFDPDAKADTSEPRTPEPTQEELKVQYVDDVRSYLDRRKNYPRQARMRRQEGDAIVRVEVSREGDVVAHEIVESTGHRLLDQEIDDVIERAAPLPRPPGALTGNSFEFDLPIRFRR